MIAADMRIPRKLPDRMAMLASPAKAGVPYEIDVSAVPDAPTHSDDPLSNKMWTVLLEHTKPAPAFGALANIAITARAKTAKFLQLPMSRSIPTRAMTPMATLLEGAEYALHTADARRRSV